jgi:hypothetical protein
MTRAKKSFRLELTKEQQALILQNTGMEAKELELTDNALKTQTEPRRVGNQPGELRSRSGRKATGPRCPWRRRTARATVARVPSVTANLRKTCLKPEYASLYPEVSPNIWLGAAGVAARVAARLRTSADSNDRPPKRVLPDEHFEFRGGRPRRQSWKGPGSRLGEMLV